MSNASIEIPRETTPPIIQVERLSYRYPNGTMALCDVSFSIQPREVVGLIGPNGAGKTTLQLHLNGLLPETVPDRSPAESATSVRVAGMAMIRPNLKEIRRQVGFLFQDPDDQLFCPTVREDVAFGPLNLGLPRDEVARRVEAGLAAVGLENVGDRGTMHLSFGERKRVCLAGILACQPSLLVLDEPTSNLDQRARRRFMELLKNSQAAQLIASHDLEMILDLCSRVLILDHGRIQADGPTLAVLSNSTLLAQHGLEVPLSVQYGRR
ncbi:MAG: ABC-type cobalt transport system, ATPase component [Planctomycetaceae bacterium]|nr:ABC-type cobalt transport system, ATPase component [Planctomycetaceae bacterium]